DAAAFGARESVDAVDLSPDGSKVLYLTPGPSRNTFAVIGDLSTGQFQKVVGSDGEPESLRWCNFASMKRMVCRFTGLAESTGIDLLSFSRLIALDADGSNPKLLGQVGSFYDEHVRIYDGRIIDWLIDSDGVVLMNRLYMPEETKIQSLVKQTKKGFGVDKIDVTTLRRQPVEGPREAADYVTDGRGSVRLMSILDTRHSGMLTGELKYSYRTKSSRDWKPLHTVRNIQDPDFVPLAIDADSDSLYVLKKRGGRYALHALRLDGSMAETLVAEHPRVDIDDVVRFGDGQRVIGYTYADEKRATVYFDPEFKMLAASLSKVLPNLPLVYFVDSSRDGRKLLIFAGSDTDPGRYYIFDRDKKTLTEGMHARPELSGRTLAAVKAVTIPASDGAQIPAYLTLPPGKDPKGLPAIVLPHGGPSARDEWGFDWLPQFLAGRGYAVLQPNYRGSAGYGDSWLKENGFRSWRTSIGDISASARWLSSQGIADPQKLAIVGWSYGGYAALQSAATDPALYKAVVAVAPVTDLALLKEDTRNTVVEELVNRFVGSGPHVAEGSPLRNPGAINAPVLLVHGDKDSNVRVWHSQKMHDALRGAGRQSELLKFKDLDHQLEDPAARTQMLTRIGDLLQRTIGR
ncbi:MAG TPA: S9 family peptidase, partial [Sphingomicrobium sp.]|nr:S9 family peptidase [Sphingomicrobium sp.]